MFVDCSQVKSFNGLNCRRFGGIAFGRGFDSRHLHQEKTSNQNTNENKAQKKVETKQTPVQPVESNQPSSVTPSQPASSGNATNAQQPQKEEQTKILRVTYWVKCDCGKELTHSIDYKDYESYYNSNDYSVKILINQLLDEGHCAGNEEVCGASHYRYGTNENWIYK